MRAIHFPTAPSLPLPLLYIIHKRIHWRIKKQFESGLTQLKHLATGNLQLATRSRQLFAANAARDEPQDVPSPSASLTHPPSHSVCLSLPMDVSLSLTNKSQFATACEIFSQQLRLLCILHLRNHKIPPLKTTDKPPANPSENLPGKDTAHAQLGKSKFCATRVLHEINCPTYLWQATS